MVKDNRMKTKLAILLFLFLGICTSCSKEEYNYSGNLEVVFENQANDIQVKIFDIANDSYPVYQLSVNKFDHSIKAAINPGNYLIMAQSLSAGISTYFYGFQIVAGTTTRLKLDDQKRWVTLP